MTTDGEEYMDYEHHGGGERKVQGGGKGASRKGVKGGWRDQKYRGYYSNLYLWRTGSIEYSEDAIGIKKRR